MTAAAAAFEMHFVDAFAAFLSLWRVILIRQSLGLGGQLVIDTGSAALGC